ncbi:nucleotidyltransferase family protein [Cyanobium sp. FGCU-52]|nr:nucleotidyltransferase family protein [Cyanobium sp. FGCU52]
MTLAAPAPRTRQQLILLLSQHKQEWRRLYGIQDIALFGSLARGEGASGSDLDLCVILDPPNPFALVHFREAVQDLVGLRVDVVTRWPGMNQALQREIERDAISI